MNNRICFAAFAGGLSAIGWVGAGYLDSHPLALAMTLLIGVVYVAGALELRRFHAATRALVAALAALPADRQQLDDWLARLPDALQNVVRLRIEGERAALPGPATTPYLVGLLVMLGMLGTFLGMVVTLNGAVLALETTTDLATIRAALASPVRGLGLAFGTSVAGVAASAMLGLISSLCRRERGEAGQLLDRAIAGDLRAFSLAWQRQETFRALQAQSRALPDVAERLAALVAQLERQGAQNGDRLLAAQDAFHAETKTVYRELAQSVAHALQSGLADGARAAGAAIQPAVEATLAGLAREANALHERIAATAETRFASLAERIEESAVTVADGWTAALAKQAARDEALAAQLRQTLEGFAHGFAQRAAALVERVDAAHAALHGEIAARDGERQAALAQSLAAMAAALREEWQAAGAQTLAQQQAICRALESTAQGIASEAAAHAGRTLDEIARLSETAAEAPRIAAEVIGRLREQLAESATRDNALLAERQRLMADLGGLLAAMDAATREQRQAIEALTAGAAVALEHASDRFAAAADAGAGKLAAATTEITGGSVEIASLAEALGLAVRQFGDTGGRLVDSFARIEGALENSLARSDEQLAYYVAQARELIDLSILSQQRVVEDLQGLSVRALAAEPA